jgi:Dna[CI] antecedent, DciA
VSALRSGEESNVGMKRADSVLAPLLKDSGIGNGVTLAGIKKNWFSLFQKPLSHHISPCLLTAGELLINVDSPAWLQELKFFKEDIRKKLHPYGIQSVRFRIGRVSMNRTSDGKSRTPESRQLDEEERSFIENAVMNLDDDGMKQTLKKTIAKAISSGRTKIR